MHRARLRIPANRWALTSGQPQWRDDLETTTRIPEIVREIRERLGLIYGPNLERLILYGSHARGEAEPGSDLDLMVVLRDFRDTEEELTRMAPIASELSLRYDVVVSFFAIRTWDFMNRNTPLLLNIRREGVSV